MKNKRLKSPNVLLNRLRKLFPDVHKVRDATSSIVVHVKSVDCNKASAGDFTDCALARATKREFKADGCLIGLSSSYVVKNGVALRYLTPDTVAREMVSFDRHGDFAKGVYHLAHVSPAVRLGGARDRRRHRVPPAKNGGSQLKYQHDSVRVRRIRRATRGGE